MNLLKLQNRIKIAAVPGVLEGTVAGRVIDLQQDRLFLGDDSGCMLFFFSPAISTPRPGDITALFYETVPEGKMVREFCLLTPCAINPLDNPRSLWHKFNRDRGQLQEILKQRSRFLRLVEDFFIDRDFIQLSTPTLVESPGLETYLEPFSTVYRGYGDDKTRLFLPTSPEFSLKEALTCGLEKIFEIAKVFRNKGENSPLHRPEFLMLEFYRAYQDYTVIMDDVEELVAFLLEHMGSPGRILHQGRVIDCSSFRRVTVKELFAPYSIDLDLYMTDGSTFEQQVRTFFRQTYQGESGSSWDNLTKEDLFFKFFLDIIEPDLGFDRPALVYEYPLEMTPLSQPCPGNELYGQRFELFIGGIELANAYGELTDGTEQKRRFLQTIEKRSSLNMSPLKLPSRFLHALDQGIPPCSGIALGLERLLMLILAKETINEVNLFDFHFQ